MNIIQKTGSIFLNGYMEDLSFIDKQIAQEFKSVATLQIKPTNALLIIKAFNVYSYLYDVKLNYLTFKNSSNKELFTDFLNFCFSDFFNYSLKFKQLIRNYLVRMIELLNNHRVINLEIDILKIKIKW